MAQYIVTLGFADVIGGTVFVDTDTNTVRQEIVEPKYANEAMAGLPITIDGLEKRINRLTGITSSLDEHLQDLADGGYNVRNDSHPGIIIKAKYVAD